MARLIHYNIIHGVVYQLSQAKCGYEEYDVMYQQFLLLYTNITVRDT